MSKKRTPKGAFHGSIGGFFSQKKKVLLENIKHSGDKKDISLNKSELGDNVFSDVDSMSGNEESANITGINVGSLLDLAANTPKAKHINTGAIFSSLLGSPNFVIDDDEDVSLSSFDPKIVKSQVEVSIRKFFAFDINFSAVEGKSGATISSKFEEIIQSMFTSEKSMEMAASLAREKGININGNFKRQKIRLDQAVVIKEIPIDMPKDMIIVTRVEKLIQSYEEINNVEKQSNNRNNKAIASDSKTIESNPVKPKEYIKASSCRSEKRQTDRYEPLDQN
ncbi:hypothetical protein G9A89_014477 [Geosiphon pyriformis]|nr:hypothetical protein G9A89_014477 [Geosiphon pyriformis]